jgi:sulfoxide reductase catalytic subunit YedY
MLIRVRRASEPKPSEITPESLHLDRRRFIAGASAAGVALVGGAAIADEASPFTDLPDSRFNTTEESTPFDKITALPPISSARHSTAVAVVSGAAGTSEGDGCHA